MKIKTVSTIAATAALAAAAAVATPTAALAADTDITVVYSTQNTAAAPIDGSYTVYGRVGVPRDDMQVKYTIQAPSVQFPIPVLDYTGTFVDTADATYSFRFGCDATVAPATCSNPGFIAQIDAMNAAVASLDGRSIATFTADVTPVIMTFGGNVPQGITGTVNVSVLSDVPGNGQLQFHLTEGQGGTALSATAVTPLVITQPTVTPDAVTAFCVAGLPAYDKDGTHYTPTNFGQDAVQLAATASDDGYYDDDATEIPVDSTLIGFQVDGASVADDAVTDAVLALPAGTHTFGATYTAPDGIPAVPASTTFTVLGADAAECYTSSALPPKPVQGGGQLAATGGDDDPTLGLTIGFSAIVAGLGALLVARRRERVAGRA